MKIAPLSPSSRTAFTLMELLVVMAILAILMTASAVAISGFAKATRLTSAGQQLSTCANVARQNSMSRNAMTALVILDDPAQPNNRRAFTLLELVPPADGSQPREWKQISPWQTLPTGIFVAFSEELSHSLDLPFASYPSARPNPDFPILQYQGQEVRSFRYVSFLPLGGLRQSKSAIVRVAEGYLDAAHGGQLVYTHPNPQGEPANYFDLSLLAATGRTRIDRP